MFFAGVFVDDGWFEAAPACVRAVREAERALMEVGVEVVPFTLFEDERAGREFDAEYSRAFYGKPPVSTRFPSSLRL